jgi:hypothetical protein
MDPLALATIRTYPEPGRAIDEWEWDAARSVSSIALHFEKKSNGCMGTGVSPT